MYLIIKWNSEQSFSEGSHILEFRQGIPPASSVSPIRQICSVEIHELDAEPKYAYLHLLQIPLKCFLYQRVSYFRYQQQKDVKTNQ